MLLRFCVVAKPIVSIERKLIALLRNLTMFGAYYFAMYFNPKMINPFLGRESNLAFVDLEAVVPDPGVEEDGVEGAGEWAIVVDLAP